MRLPGEMGKWLSFKSFLPLSRERDGDSSELKVLQKSHWKPRSLSWGGVTERRDKRFGGHWILSDLASTLLLSKVLSAPPSANLIYNTYFLYGVLRLKRLCGAKKERKLAFWIISDFRSRDLSEGIRTACSSTWSKPPPPPQQSPRNNPII